MGRLLGMCTYLAGPMDRCPNGGVQWRRDLTPWLQDRGIIVLDPTDKPIDLGDESPDARSRWQASKSAGDYDWLRDHVKLVRHVDLRMVDISHFVVAFIDMDIVMTGTMEELFWSNRSKKPVLVVCKQGKAAAPDWLFGTVPPDLIFGSFEHLKDYLDEVDTAAEVEDFGRWIFFDAAKMYTPRLLEQIGSLHRPAASGVA